MLHNQKKSACYLSSSLPVSPPRLSNFAKYKANHLILLNKYLMSIYYSSPDQLHFFVINVKHLVLCLVSDAFQNSNWITFFKIQFLPDFRSKVLSVGQRVSGLLVLSLKGEKYLLMLFLLMLNAIVRAYLCCPLALAEPPDLPVYINSKIKHSAVNHIFILRP